jgi:hypothetical protein
MNANEYRSWYITQSRSEEIRMAHPVDEYVGKRVRQRRWMVGYSQQQLVLLEIQARSLHSLAVC